ncbi:MAG: copper resistance CopC/CopD family protein [Acidimicrobiales bacterium]
MLGWFFAFASPAGAHNSLTGSEPPDGATLPAGGRLILQFAADVPLETMSVDLVQTSGVRTPVVGLSHAASPREVLVPLPPAITGELSLRWRLVGPDGHVITDRLSYTVEQPGSLAPGVPTTLPAAAEPAPPVLQNTVEPADSPVGGFGRWLLRAGSYLALVAAMGLAVTGRLVWPGLFLFAQARQALLVALAAVAVLGFTQLAVLAGDITQRSPWSALDALNVAFRTDAGIALGVRVAVAALAGIALAWERTWSSVGTGRDWALLGVGVALLGTWSFAGHARSMRWPVVGVPVDLLHHAAAATWLGGLGVVGVIGLRILPPPDAARVVERFATIAAASVAMLGVTGLIGAARFIEGIDSLFDPHTRLLAAKLIVLSAMLWVANVNRKRVMRWAAVGTNPRRGHIWALRRAMTTELVIGVAVIAITAVMVVTTPVIST